jgi:ribosomal-protein-alanine N-acetyltransferase
MDISGLIIESKNLYIKTITLDYASDIFKEFTLEITRYMSPKPAEKIEDTIAFIEGAIKSNIAGTDWQAMIISKETNDFIGCTGLHKIDTPHPEFGIWLKKSAHGHGYGKEAIVAMKDWADQNLAYEYLIYPVDKANVASCRIPEFLGGKISGEHTDVGMGGNQLNIVEYRIYKK